MKHILIGILFAALMSAFMWLSAHYWYQTAVASCLLVAGGFGYIFSRSVWR